MSSDQILTKHDKHEASSNDKPFALTKHQNQNVMSILVDDKVDLTHLVDLDATPKSFVPKSLAKIPLIHPSIDYLHYFARVMKHLFLTLLFDWITIIAHPINSLLIFMFFPLVSVCLFFLESFLRIVKYMIL